MRLRTRVAEAASGLANRRPWLIIGLTGALSIGFAFAALRVEVSSDFRDLFPEDAETTRLLHKYGGDRVARDYLFVAVEALDATDPFTLEGLQALQRMIDQVRQRPEIDGVLSPMGMLTFLSRPGGRLVALPAAAGGVAPTTVEQLEQFRATLLNDPGARNLVLSKSGTALNVIFSVVRSKDVSELLTVVTAASEPLQEFYNVHIAGPPTFSQLTRDYLLHDAPTLMMLALVVMLVVYYTGFRTPIGVMLPLVVVVIGTLWTVGTMGLLGLQLTVISILTPPLVLTLGSSYSTHLLNQYYREAHLRSLHADWMQRSVNQVLATVLLSAVTTIIGFASLRTATLQSVRQFGLATSFGIFYCALLALIFFPACLTLLRPPRLQQSRRITHGLITRVLTRLGLRIRGLRYFAIPAIATVVVVFAFVVPNIEYQTDLTSFYSKREPVVRANVFFVREFGGFLDVNLTLTAPESQPGYFTEPAVLAHVAVLEEALADHVNVPYVSSMVTYLKRMNRALTGSYELPASRPLVLLLARLYHGLADSGSTAAFDVRLANEDFSSMTLTFRVFDSTTQGFMFDRAFRQTVSDIEGIVATTLPAEVTAEMWGGTLATLQLSEILLRDLVNSIIVSAVLVFLFVSIGMRSVPFGLLSLIPMVTGIMLNFILMYLARIPLNLITVMFSSVAIGVGVDNAIHLLLHYRRHSETFAGNIRQILTETLRSAGRPITVTSLSLVAGLLVLAFSSFTPVRQFGLLISISVLTTGIAALVVLPALLALVHGMGEKSHPSSDR